MRSRRALKDISQSRTEDGGTEGQVQSRIFINEDLTKLRSNLLYHARQLKKQKKLQDLGWRCSYKKQCGQNYSSSLPSRSTENSKLKLAVINDHISICNLL